VVSYGHSGAYSNLSTITSVFRYLGVHVDSNNTYDYQRKLFLQQIKDDALVVLHKHASPDTIYIAGTKSFQQRKVSFPLMPWSLSTLRTVDKLLNSLMKNHLHFMPSTTSAAHYKPINVGGLGGERSHMD